MPFALARVFNLAVEVDWLPDEVVVVEPPEVVVELFVKTTIGKYHRNLALFDLR